MNGKKKLTITNEDGTKKIYQYKNGKFKKSIDFDSMECYAKVQKVSKKRITMDITVGYSALGVFGYECNLMYKSGKLQSDAKIYKNLSYGASEGDKPYMTANRKIQLYKSHNTKRRLL